VNWGHTNEMKMIVIIAVFRAYFAIA